jgi:hypothetical protein
LNAAQEVAQAADDEAHEDVQQDVSRKIGIAAAAGSFAACFGFKFWVWRQDIEEKRRAPRREARLYREGVERRKKEGTYDPDDPDEQRLAAHHVQRESNLLRPGREQLSIAADEVRQERRPARREREQSIDYRGALRKFFGEYLLGNRKGHEDLTPPEIEQEPHHQRPLSDMWHAARQREAASAIRAARIEEQGTDDQNRDDQAVRRQLDGMVQGATHSNVAEDGHVDAPLVR